MLKWIRKSWGRYRERRPAEKINPTSGTGYRSQSGKQGAHEQKDQGDRLRDWRGVDLPR